MSTLTYSHDGVAAPSVAQATEKGRSKVFWRRIYDAMIASQQRLVVEGIHLGRAPMHEQKDYPFGACREVRGLDR